MKQSLLVEGPVCARPIWNLVHLYHLDLQVLLVERVVEGEEKVEYHLTQWLRRLCKVADEHFSAEFRVRHLTH